MSAFYKLNNIVYNRFSKLGLLLKNNTYCFIKSTTFNSYWNFHTSVVCLFVFCSYLQFQLLFYHKIEFKIKVPRMSYYMTVSTSNSRVENSIVTILNFYLSTFYLNVLYRKIRCEVYVTSKLFFKVCIAV